MYLLLLSSRKNLLKYIEGSTTEELKRNSHVLIAEGGIIKKKDFPKHTKVFEYNFLIPPPNIITEFLSSSNEDVFSDACLRYYYEPRQRYALAQIVSACYLERHNVVICFGDIEKEFNLHKYIKEVIESIYEDIKVFTYKDFKNNYNKVISFKPTEDQINCVERELRASRAAYEYTQTCKDPYDSALF